MDNLPKEYLFFIIIIINAGYSPTNKCQKSKLHL